MQTNRLKLATTAILRLAHELRLKNLNPLKNQILLEVVHLALDTLHRFVLNLRP